MPAPRGLFAPAVVAGAAFFVTAPASLAVAADLDAPMQPIARGAAVPAPAKRPAAPTGDASAEPDAILGVDRMAPEYSGEPMARESADPMDPFVDRTVDNLNSTTNSLLRTDRP